MAEWAERISWSRALSLLVAAIYVLAPVVAGWQKSLREVLGMVVAIGAYLIIPLVCIWFSDEMGDYIGTLPGPAINRRSPGWMVNIGGWFLLLLPVLILVFSLTFS